ncbi:MAG: PEP-CTERM sorting domain-containing protein [Phycisphaerales bacterium]
MYQKNIRPSIKNSLCIGSHRVLAALMMLALAPKVACAAPSFQGLGDLPGAGTFSYARGLSADGSVVTGYSGSALGVQAFIWTAAGGMVGLGDLPDGSFSSFGNGISPDGSYVVGQGNSALGPEAFIWSAGTGMIGLGDLPGGAFLSGAGGVSADGSVVVGVSESTASGRDEAFYWTSATGMVGLGNLPGGNLESSAFGISADGSVIVGRSSSAQASSGFEAFRWTAISGMMGLGDLPGGVFYSEARAGSADGSAVVGKSNSAASSVGDFDEAFLWTAATGMVGLGDLPGGVFNSVALDVSATGAVVVGSGVSDLGGQAFIWDPLHGMRALQNVLTDLGLDLTGWELTVAEGISDDGLVITGWGTNPNGDTEAFIARLPEPGTLAVFGLGVTALLRRRRGRDR